jgi:hypothetical protein
MARKYDPFSRNYVGFTEPAATDTAVIQPGFYFKSHNLQHHYTVIQNLYGVGALGGRTRAAWQTRLGWVNESTSFRGFQLSVPWGLYETGANGGGDFTNLDHLETVVNELGSLGKYVILMPFQFREFRNGDVSGLGIDDQMRYLLPEDLRTHQGVVDSVDILVAAGETVRSVTGTPSAALGVNGDYAHNATTNILYGPKAGGVWPAGIDLDTADPRRHWLWDYAYGYEKNQNGGFGFEMKIYKSELRTRMLRFAQAVADKFNANPTVIGIHTTESINGGATYLGSDPGGIVDDGYTATTALVNNPTNAKRAGLTGKTLVLQAARPMFPNKFFAQDINVPLNGVNYVKEYFDYMQQYRMGSTTSDVGWWEPDLNILGPEPLRGCLPRMSDTSSIAPTTAQWQQDGWDSTTHGAPKISSTADYNQRYADIFARTTTGNAKVVFGMNCHMCIIQLETQYNVWLGGTTQNTSSSGTGYNPDAPNGTVVPSLKDWLKAKFTAEGITDGSGGLNTVRPLYVGYNSTL